MPEAISPDAVLALIIEQQIVESAEPLTPATDLFGQGMDSMAMMQLLLHIEDRFGVAVAPADMTRDRFQNAEAIAQFLLAKQG